MTRLMLILAATTLAGCGDAGASRLEGRWTPVSVADCGAGGEAGEVSGTGLTYRSGRSFLELIRFGEMRSSADTVDVEARFRKFPPDTDEPWHPKEVLRFEVRGDTARVLGTVDVDGEITPLRDAMATRVLTMRRCP